MDPCVLTFEHILSEAEATLNSRPLLTMDSTLPDGVTALTPGHFLVGCPLLATPLKVGSSFDFRPLNAVVQEYLQFLQAHHQWKQALRNFRVGDVVLLKDENSSIVHGL